MYIQICTHLQEEYSYDEEASKEKSNGDGIRLVGAARADTAKFPFVIGFTLTAMKNRDFSQCTGEFFYFIKGQTNSYITSKECCQA